MLNTVWRIGTMACKPGGRLGTVRSMADSRSIWNEYPAPRYVLGILAAIAVAVGIWARFWHLGHVETPIFDEIYFPVFANAFLHHKTAFDVHPPLGKFLLAAGIYLFGDTPLGWRIVPAIFGLLNVGLLLGIWQAMSGGRAGSLMLLLLAGLDGSLIVYSRTGLIDGILLAGILSTVLLAWQTERGKSLLPLTLALGLAVTIKWIGLGAIVPVLFILWRRGRLIDFLPLLPLSALVYFLVTVAGQAIGGVHSPVSEALNWHWQALNYQLKLTATHPYASRWWEWPLMLRPVLFYYQGVGSGTEVIDAMSSPVVWGAADIAVLLTLGTLLKRAFSRDGTLLDSPLAPLLIGYLSFWLPWSLVTRVVFQYHYLPSYAFALLMLAYWLHELWKRSPWASLLIVGLLMASSLYFLPFAIGTPLSTLWLSRHVWYYHWIY